MFPHVPLVPQIPLVSLVHVVPLVSLFSLSPSLLCFSRIAVYNSDMCENESSLLAQCDRTCTTSPTIMLSVPKDRVIAYVLQETKLKLE